LVPPLLLPDGFPACFESAAGVGEEMADAESSKRTVTVESREEKIPRFDPPEAEERGREL
jgi:hypothetical protein